MKFCCKSLDPSVHVWCSNYHIFEAYNILNYLSMALLSALDDDDDPSHVKQSFIHNCKIMLSLFKQMGLLLKNLQAPILYNILSAF